MNLKHNHRMDFKNLKRMAAVAVAAVSFTGALMGQTEDHNTYTHDSTMNALDYVLQRPLPNQKFAKKRFGDRLFLSIEAGPEWMRTHNGLIGLTKSKAGFRGAITIGDWVTPVHGWKVGIGGGQHVGLNDMKPYFGSVSVDYLMKLTALAGYDNPSRRFELIGLIGLEGEVLHRDGHSMWASGGLRIGLQPRVYFNNSTFLYIEPRLGVFTDALDDVSSWHRYDWNASIMIGLGYRLNGGRGYRVDNSLWVDDCFRDNLFIGFSGGMNMMGHSGENIRKRLGYNGGVFIGKWFTPASGLRIKGEGYELNQLNHSRRWAGNLDIDYMWNLNSSMNGYDPDRSIEANILLGVNGALVSDSGTKFYPGVNFGLQGVWNVSRAVSLFVEPSVHLFGRGISYDESRRATFVPSVNVGLAYRFRGSEEYRQYRKTFDYNDFLESERYFFDLTGGVLRRSNAWERNFVLSLGFGKWFTPESAWRVRGDYVQFGHDHSYRSVKLSGDYMMSLSTLASGFDPYRPFDFDAFVGLTAGVAHYNKGKNSIVVGPEVGLRGRIRASDNVDVLIEPSFGVLRIPDYRNRTFTPDAKIMAGVSYKVRRDSKKPASESVLVDGDGSHDYFASFIIGPALYSETVYTTYDKKVSPAFEASVGHWFNDISGLRAGLGYQFLNRYQGANLNLGYLYVDYMLSLTGLFRGEQKRFFNFAAFGGPGIGWSNLGEGLSPMAHFGVEARFNVWKQIDVTFTPTVNVWLPRLSPNEGNNHKFGASATFPIGVSYRF